MRITTRYEIGPFYDEHGARQYEGGFATKSQAREWVDAKVDEIEALRRGGRGTPVNADARRALRRVRRLASRRGEHEADARGTAALRPGHGARLDDDGWRTVRLDRLDAREIGQWRSRLPERSAHVIHMALRQVLNYAARVKLLDESPAALVANPEPKRSEPACFESVTRLRDPQARERARRGHRPELVAELVEQLVEPQ